MQTTRRIGVDIGGTKVLAVAFGDEYDVVAEARVPTPRDPDALVEAIAQSIDQLGVAPQTIGIGIAGLVTVAGDVLVSPHLAEPEKLHLVKRLGGRFGVTVRVDNDANAAAWGEAVAGAGHGVDNVAVVTLGTGIGAGLVINGRLVRGAHGFGGEPGHTTVNFDGRRHVTGARGSWEMYASGTALHTLAKGNLTAAAIATPEGAAVLARYGRDVAIGVANLITLLDLELVVLGGGVSVLGEPLVDAVRAELPAWVFGPDVRPKLHIELAQLGEVAGAVGAALLGALDDRAINAR